jgi:two-component sensor histidine kinase
VWRGRFRALFSRPEEKQIDLELALPDRRRRVLRLVGRTMDAPPRPLRGQDHKKGSVLMLVAFEVTDEIVAREQSRDLVAEKELLLRELRHRTQNHLVTIQSMLAFQAAHAGNPAVADALTGAGERIRAMLLVNEILTSRRGQETVDLAIYLSDLLERIGQAQMALAGITVETELASLSVTADTAFTLGLVVNELVTNAHKYAFSHDAEEKTVRVTLRRDADTRAELIVSDNGVGIDINTSNATPDAASPSGGFGLHLVEGLVGQMDGEVTVENTGHGTRCRVLFHPGSAGSVTA